MPNVTTGYEMFSDLISSLGIITSSNLYKLCVKAEVCGLGMKSKPL